MIKGLIVGIIIGYLIGEWKEYRRLAKRDHLAVRILEAVFLNKKDAIDEALDYYEKSPPPEDKLNELIYNMLLKKKNKIIK